MQIAPGVYQIPFSAILPKRTEVGNLLVVAAPSASHIGMSTLRMEPQFMILGHSAGAVAALAVRDAAFGSVNGTAPGTVSVHDIDVAALRADLLRGGMKLDAPPSPAPPATAGFDCLQQRCVQRSGSGAGGGSHRDASCDGACTGLKQNEWIALDDYFDIDSETKTMTVNKRAPAAGTYLKKSELHSRVLPPAELRAVQRGDRFNLSSWATLDGTYTLVALA